MPLAIWVQWHHGASFQDGVAVGPFKDIPPSHCSANRRSTTYHSYLRMRKFCKALDDTSNISGRESIADLGTIFDQNTAQWRELGILQPTLTPMNQSCNRNKNDWNCIACKWEKLLQLKKRAADTGVSVDILLEA